MNRERSRKYKCYERYPGTDGYGRHAGCLICVFHLGESEATARQYLTLADGNVEMAISLMFEGGRPPETENANPEPPVRAPILPTREILVPSDPMCSLPQLSNNVFDRFRDFAVETRKYYRII